MDLERMHAELYRNKYLTPDEFLDDIRKIVHNAHVRFHEDPDRLYRAQAMLTAAEVSIGDFDPQFRVECQRMAVREHKRRDERKKTKDKEKVGEEVASTSAPRRSARNAGQQAEIPITDPLKLERRLKRQRSNEAGATPSEDEANDRSQKRSRNDTNEPEDDRDPLDLVGQPSSPPRPVGVRFADNTEASGTVLPSTPNGIQTEPLPDAPRRTGFDPSLLNPLPPTVADLITPSIADPSGSESVPLSVELASQEHTQIPSMPILQTHNIPLVDGPVSAGPDVSMSSSTPITPAVETQVALIVQENATQAMEIERTPTPLPDFHVDEGALLQLKALLRDSTGSLNVEQLEQLRATCLSCIWRHRTEWDRDGLVQELTELVKEFVEEVALDDVDMAASPLSHS